MIIYTQMIESPADKTKFEAVYLKYRGLMYRVAYQVLRNEHDAEDVVHQAFLSIIENLNKISQVDCLKTRAYVVIIVERKAIDIIRSRKRIVDDEYDDSIGGYEIQMPSEDRLSQALAMLPAQHRELLLLRYAQGYDTREVAKIMGMSYDAARKSIWRAKAALKNQLEREGVL